MTKISWRPFKNTASILGENNTTLFLGENNPTSFARTLDDQERGSWQELREPAPKYLQTGRARRCAIVPAAQNERAGGLNAHRDPPGRPGGS